MEDVHGLLIIKLIYLVVYIYATLNVQRILIKINKIRYRNL